MEDSVVSTNTLLQRVLKSYQNAAVRSLSGPTDLPIDLSQVKCPSSNSGSEDPERTTQKSSTANDSDGKSALSFEPPVLPAPVFTPVDSRMSKQSETNLEDEVIACFDIGGEKRLCLPQILNTVLRDVTLQDINTVCDDLHIFCTQCNDAQLVALKKSGILPAGAPSCGLITKTDAERLCSALVSSKEPESDPNPPSVHSIRVYHSCFGKGDGHFNPDRYTSPNARCIQCAHCQGLFSPKKFVCHSHRAAENWTCHWGFESDRWRDYLFVKDKKCQDALEEIKSKFDPKHKHKRRQVSRS